MNNQNNQSNQGNHNNQNSSNNNGNQDWQTNQNSSPKKNVQMQVQELDLDIVNNPSFELGKETIKFFKDNLQINKYGVKNNLNNEMLANFNFDPANLKIQKKIGQGASSQVYRGRYFLEEQSMLVAVKSINVLEKKLRDQIISDIKNMVGTYNPNLVTFYGCYYEKLCIKQILEYMDVGSLRDIIVLINKHQLQMEEKVISNIARQILMGLRHIHEEKQMIHRDIKPENVLINSSGQIKIADFGISKRTNDGIALTFVGTLVYMSPERVKPPTCCTYKSDVWSVGVMIYEMATGDNPYKLTADSSIVDRILGLLERKQPQLEGKTYSPEFSDFLSYCLCKDINKRCLPSKLLSHPWITMHFDDTVLPNWVHSLIQRKVIVINQN